MRRPVATEIGEEGNEAAEVRLSLGASRVENTPTPTGYYPTQPKTAENPGFKQMKPNILTRTNLLHKQTQPV